MTINTLYVVTREDGKFVAPSGSEHSYTDKLQKARIFPDRNAAMREKCGNESAQPLANFLNIE